MSTVILTASYPVASGDARMLKARLILDQKDYDNARDESIDDRTRDTARKRVENVLLKALKEQGITLHRIVWGRLRLSATGAEISSSTHEPPVPLHMTTFR